MTTPDLEVLDDDEPDVLAIEDTEPVPLIEDGEVDPTADRECGCADEDDDDVSVTDEDDV